MRFRDRNAPRKTCARKETITFSARAVLTLMRADRQAVQPAA
jgi:hypothetical protein